MLLLFSPLKYWRIHHPVKRIWDWWLPSIAAAGLTLILFAWPSLPKPWAANGFFAGLQNLYAILGGFFVAALTLLTTAQTDALSRPIPGWPMTTYGDEALPLTRQRFLCLLFGYLAFSAFGLYSLGLISTLMAPGFAQILPAGWIRKVVSIPVVAIYNFWLFHTFFATLVGLYYFTDRLQRPDVDRVEHPAE